MPFIQAMNFWLTETSARFKRPSLVTVFMSKTNQEYEDSAQLMKQVAYESEPTSTDVIHISN